MSEILAVQSAQAAARSEATGAAVQATDQQQLASRGPLRRLVARLRFPARRASARDDGVGEADLPLIDRIVLYIDDLDRCPPSRVVEVLEAVHLILALPLFVVVVAVDPRWLLQSLHLHYSELLAGALRERDPREPARGDADSTLEQWQDGARAGTEAAWRSTPLHYLEKIIQIPFTLRPMGRKGVESLVTKLLPVQADEEPAGVGAGDRRRPPGRVGESEQSDAQPHPERDEPTPHSTPAAPTHRPLAPALSPRTLALTGDERDFAVTVGCILRTPRSVKKFTNLYRLVRARLDEESGELDAFLEAEGDDIPEYQAVLVLLAVIIAFPDEASAFLLDLGDLEPRTGPDRRPWRDYVEELQRRTGGRWHELASFLDDATTKAISGNAATRDPFRRRALEISRYSFATGQEIFSRYHAGPQLEPSSPPPPTARAIDDQAED